MTFSCDCIKQKSSKTLKNLIHFLDFKFIKNEVLECISRISKDNVLKIYAKQTSYAYFGSNHNSILDAREF